MSECKCLAPILTVSQLPIQLVEIVQSYLHSKIAESFWKEIYKNFSLCVRLDKQRNIVEYTKMSYSSNDRFPPFIDRKDFLVELLDRNPALDDAARWLHMIFNWGGSLSTYTTCITHNIASSNSSEDEKEYKYKVMHKKLVEYFSGGNMSVLLTKMKQENRAIPNEEDYERIWYTINSILATWMKGINFYQEIHR